MLTLVAEPVMMILGAVLASVRTDTQGLAIEDFRGSVKKWEADVYQNLSSRGSLYMAASSPYTTDR